MGPVLPASALLQQQLSLGSAGWRRGVLVEQGFSCLFFFSFPFLANLAELSHCTNPAARAWSRAGTRMGL